MAHTPECDRALKTLAGGPPDPLVPLPPLDPRAVAAVALRSLATLGSQQLLSPDECATLIAPFLQNGNDLVRVSVAMHLLNRLPERRRMPLQRLLRYLKRLASFSDTCTVPGLAQSVGLALLQPEKLPMGTTATNLTAAAVQCAGLLIKYVAAFLFFTLLKFAKKKFRFSFL